MHIEAITTSKSNREGDIIMKKLIPIVVLGTMFAPACVDTDPEDVGSAADAIACDTDDDCPTGLECEIEHGDAFCKPHGGDDDGEGGSIGDASGLDCQVDADCPAGQECEVEHGESFCKPHGGDAGEGGAANECVDDLDCPAGEECEFEHGASFCKPHGGN
jgi:hypothetical protein